MHVVTPIVELSLRRRFGLEEIIMAREELWEKGYLLKCWEPSHDPYCYIITAKGLAYR